MSAAQAMKQIEFDATPIVNMYVASIQNWQKSCGSLAKSMASNENFSAPKTYNSTQEAFMGSLQQSGTAMFNRFVETQIDLCRFYECRLMRYLKIPGSVAACRTPSDLTQVQSSFLNDLVTDYAAESTKLMKPFKEQLSLWCAHPES